MMKLISHPYFGKLPIGVLWEYVVPLSSTLMDFPCPGMHGLGQRVGGRLFHSQRGISSQDLKAETPVRCSAEVSERVSGWLHIDAP